jgi:hypothetical protein
MSIVGEPAPHVRETGPYRLWSAVARLRVILWTYHYGRSLAQLLKHVKVLAARQRFLRSAAAPPSREDEARVAWPDLEVRGRRIVDDRVLPNLVLLDRGEETS